MIFHELLPQRLTRPVFGSVKEPRESWQGQSLKIVLKLLVNLIFGIACSLARGCGLPELLSLLFHAVLAKLAIGKILVVLKATLLGKLNFKHCPRAGRVVALVENAQLCSCLASWTCDINGLVFIFLP